MLIDLLSWLLILLTPPLAILWLVVNIKKRIRGKSAKSWGFFHPFCNDGGGGEKVLWCMVKQLAEKTEDQIVIYSLEANKQLILERVSSRFGINISANRFRIIHVEGRSLLTAKGFLTMILHLVLPMLYAAKCLLKHQPDIFYDTTGYASTLVLVKLLLPGITTAAYVHYPFISQDMIQKVRESKADFNNNQRISRSPFLTKAKLYYYMIVLQVYKMIGRAVDVAQTNSSWTHNHMSSLWPRLLKKDKLIKLYPPCTVKPLLAIKKPDSSKEIVMMSLAQFRPEKHQLLQIQVLSELLKANLKRKVILKICGTTRGADDELILQGLKNLASSLKVQNNVQFVVNQPYSKIIQCFKESRVGIHTMEAEHFGISVVEMLAAGLIVVAHNSAGPKMDIIKDQRFLAESKEDYIEKLKQIIQCSEEQLNKQTEANRRKAQSFSEEQFQKHFLQSMQKNTA